MSFGLRNNDGDVAEGRLRPFAAKPVFGPRLRRVNEASPPHRVSPVQSPSAFPTLRKVMPRHALECGDLSPLSCVSRHRALDGDFPRKAATSRRTPKADGL
jgi:hypothetical protein